MNYTVLITVAFAACLSQASMARDYCKHQREINRSAELNGVKDIYVKAGAGKLFIQGSPERDDILIQAIICASDQSVFDEMDVRASQNADTTFIKTHIPERKFAVGNNYARIDLNVIVPADSNLGVADSSGAAQVGNVRQLDMIDSSGRLVINDVEGDVKVKDSSGKLVLRDIGGNVQIVDSSGAIEAENIGQSVTVVHDSSGGIRLKNIGKDVTVQHDSSGGIDVDTVAGNFSVLEDSSCGIRYKNVGGQVQIPEHKRRNEH